MAPLLRRTWAPQGNTPELRHRTRLHKKVSAIATLGIPPHRHRGHCQFRLYPDQNIDSERIVDYLHALLRHVQGPMLLIWDQLTAHRARLTTQFIATQPRIHLVILPTYAPELNPVEYLWANAKLGPMANFAPLDLGTLTQTTRRTLRSIQQQPARLRSLLRHSPLSLRLQ